MRRIIFSDLHYTDVNYFNVYMITGVVEVVEVYLRMKIERLLHAENSVETSVSSRSKSLFNMDMLRGIYDEEQIEAYIRKLGDNTKLETCSYENLFSINFSGASRLCIVDLAHCSNSEFGYYMSEIRNKNWGDNLVSDGNAPVYLFFTFDDVVSDDKQSTQSDIKTMLTRRKALKNLEDVLRAKDELGSRNTSRLLWVSARANQKRRDIYTWMTDLLSDRVTTELLWECSGACGELNSLRGFYTECVMESEAVADDERLGDRIKKKDLRQSDLYTNLLFVDGRELARCMIRFVTKEDYKGRSLKTLVRKGFQIEHTSLSGERDDYAVGLRKANRFLKSARSCIAKWLIIRSMQETGIIPSTLSRAQLSEPNVVNTFRHYGVNYVVERDLEITAEFLMQDFVDVLGVVDVYLRKAREVLETNSKLDEITGKKSAPVNLFISLFEELQVMRKKKLGEVA